MTVTATPATDSTSLTVRHLVAPGQVGTAEGELRSLREAIDAATQRDEFLTVARLARQAAAVRVRRSLWQRVADAGWNDATAHAVYLLGRGVVELGNDELAAVRVEAAHAFLRTAAPYADPRHIGGALASL